MLYLGTQVLILLDLSYVSRFWTQFEAWLSMQFATPSGLKSAVGTRNTRHHIVAIQNAAAQSELYTKALVDNWAEKTPEQAFEFLSKPDVTVTNQSDKDGQLPKIKSLGETVQGAFKAIGAQLQQRVAASEEAAARAKAALEAFEVENDVKAGAGNPLKAAATRAELEAAAARTAKEKQRQAIAHGVAPMVMEREEGRQLVEAARKVEAEATAAKERAAAAARAAEERAAAEARAAKERAAAAAREANATRTAQFRGPCKDVCASSCACCCVSADGMRLYGCVPLTDGEVQRDYFLPLCLHTCLCPQQGGECVGDDLAGAALAFLLANTCLCCMQDPNSSGRVVDW
jgi:hypothetical protein